MRRSKKHCKFGESKADIRIISKGKETGEAIENSFPCFFSYVFDSDEVAQLKDWKQTRFDVEKGDIEDIIHDIYSEIIFMIYAKELVVRNIFIQMNKRVKVIAETANTEKFKDCLRGEIKAITYHNLNIIKGNNNVILDLTFDV